MSEGDGIPVIIKHLPDWESVRSSTRFIKNREELLAELGERPVFAAIDLLRDRGRDRQYPSGQLLIAEFTSPQASVDADAQINAALIAEGSDRILYKRIGNYNVLLLDVTDRAAGTALVDQVKYEKEVHWLGDNPFRISAERAFILTTSDVFLSTVLAIVLGIGLSIVFGLIVGFFYFRTLERRRVETGAFSDAGGLTMLDLHGFTEPTKLLKTSQAAPKAASLYHSNYYKNAARSEAGRRAAKRLHPRQPMRRRSGSSRDPLMPDAYDLRTLAR